jgi:hypothetical protein
VQADRAEGHGLRASPTSAAALPGFVIRVAAVWGRAIKQGRRCVAGGSKERACAKSSARWPEPFMQQAWCTQWPSLWTGAARSFCGRHLRSVRGRAVCMDDNGVRKNGGAGLV